MLTVAAYTDPLLAPIVRGRLEAEGIAAWVADEHTVLNDWALRQALGGVKVRVAPAQFVEARAIVREFDAGAFLLEGEGPGPPCRDSLSSRVALVVLFLLSLPLPWRRASREH